MRRRKLLVGLIGLTAYSGLLVQTAHADRRTGLGGNILIEDPDDLFPFPQYTLQHRNMIRLDYGGSQQSGNGVLTMGDDEQAVGLALHRGDLLTPDVVGFNQELAWLGGVGNPFASTTGIRGAGFVGPADDPDDDDELVLPATVVDLSYARALGARDVFGARFGFGRGVRAYNEDDTGVTKGAQTFFAAQVGYSSLPIDGLRFDTSGNVVLAFGKSTVADEDVSSGYDLRIGALGRAYYPLNQFVDIGFLGNVSIDNEHVKFDEDSSKINDFQFGLMAGVGPSIKLDRAKIAAYGGLRMELGKLEPNSDEADDELGRIRFAAPMFNMAAEVQVLDWLYVRTGAEYTWQVVRNSDETQKLRVSDGGFRWSAGLGLQRGSFYFDGVVQNAFVTGGPNFIGGNADGFLAMASLTYKFGDVFGSSATRRTPAAEVRPIERPVAPPPPPPPPPEPVVEVPAEPDQELAPPAVDATGGANRGRGSVGASGNVSVGGR
jgi:hypothetical protein